MTHPAEAHQRNEQIRRAELLADVDRLNHELLEAGAKPGMLAIDLEDAPLSEIRSVRDHARRRLSILNEQ